MKSPPRLLCVSYPLLTVSDESAGGAEQMLSVLECEMAKRGVHTIVAASDGSRVAGELLATGAPAHQNDRLAERERQHFAAIFKFLQQTQRSSRPVHLVHDFSGSFWRRAAEVDVPVLATLHLARSLYLGDLFSKFAPNVFFNCVSQSQRANFADLPRLMDVVNNGIPLERFPLVRDKSDYLLWIGRVCEEKAPHLAIEIARRTGLPLTLAGQVYPFSYHEQYYRREIRPELGEGKVRFLETPTFSTKVRLLANARALLVPTSCDESSSLVAMEAMACGTPVIAFRRGALPEVVADCETGFIVNDVEEMTRAVTRVQAISPERCRQRAEQFFSASRMADDYEHLYNRVMSLARAAKNSPSSPHRGTAAAG